MKAEYTVFEDAVGYWFVPHAAEAAAIAAPSVHRKDAHTSKIAACRAALADALTQGATELHLHGMGATLGIKADAAATGVKPYIYHPSITTKIAPFGRAGKPGKLQK